MTLRGVFFSNSGNVFSHRFFEALSQTPARLAAVVEVPPAKRVSTNLDAAAMPGDDDAAPEVVASLGRASANIATGGGLLRLRARPCGGDPDGRSQDQCGQRDQTALPCGAARGPQRLRTEPDHAGGRSAQAQAAETRSRRVGQQDRQDRVENDDVGRGL